MPILGAPGIYKGRQLIAWGAAKLTANELCLTNTGYRPEDFTNWSIIKDFGDFFLANKRINLAADRTDCLLQATFSCSWQNNGTGTRQIDYYSALGPIEEFRYRKVENGIGTNSLQLTVQMPIQGDNEMTFSVKQITGVSLNLLGGSTEVETHLVGAIYRL